MSGSSDALAQRLAELGQAAPADYVSQRRQWLDEIIGTAPSPESRERLRELQRSIDGLRAISGGTAQSLPELLAMIQESLQAIVALSGRLLDERDGPR